MARPSLRLALGCVAAVILVAGVFAASALLKPHDDGAETGSPTMATVSRDPAIDSPGGRVKGDPRSLIVPRDELPGDFAMAGGEPSGANVFAQVYFNPDGLLSKPGADPGLLGVIVNLAVLDDARTANEMFIDLGGLDADSVRRMIPSATPGAVALSVEPYTAVVAEADRVLAFRVQYELQDTEVYEYRYRLVVNNALVNLIISARATADGREPPRLRELAHAVVERQVARLNSSRE